MPHLHVHLLPRTANDGFFQVYCPGAVPAVEQRAALDRWAIILRASVNQAVNHHPTLVGTIPIGLDVAGSDADLICEAQDLDAFARDALAFSTREDFSLYRRRDGLPCAVCRFRLSSHSPCRSPPSGHTVT